MRGNLNVCCSSSNGDAWNGLLVDWNDDVDGSNDSVAVRTARLEHQPLVLSIATCRRECRRSEG